MSRTIEFTDAELLAVQLLVAVGVTGLTTPAGPAHEIKRRMEKKHNTEISLDHLQSVMRKVSDGPQPQRNETERAEQ